MGFIHTWGKDAAELSVLQLINENVTEEEAGVYTGGTVQRGDKAGVSPADKK